MIAVMGRSYPGPLHGRFRYALVGEIYAELDARLGPAKVRRLRALLVELDAALDER